MDTNGRKSWKLNYPTLQPAGTVVAAKVCVRSVCSVDMPMEAGPIVEVSWLPVPIVPDLGIPEVHAQVCAADSYFFVFASSALSALCYYFLLLCLLSCAVHWHQPR